MAEAYSMINQKLQDSVSEQEYLERMITELKVYINVTILYTVLFR